MGDMLSYWIVLLLCPLSLNEASGHLSFKGIGLSKYRNYYRNTERFKVRYFCFLSERYIENVSVRYPTLYEILPKRLTIKQPC